MILFDPPTARDVVDALRIYEGRLRGTGRGGLSEGALELRRVAERSLRAVKDQAVVAKHRSAEDRVVTELYTFDETAALMRTSVTTVKRLAREGLLPVVHVGRSVRVRPADLAEFIQSLPAQKENR